MFTRMQQRAMHRGAGATGCRVLLVDKSTSMPLDAFGMLDEVMPAIQRTHPGIRVYAFFYGVEEVRFTSIRDSIKYIHHRMAFQTTIGRPANHGAPLAGTTRGLAMLSHTSPG